MFWSRHLEFAFAYKKTIKQTVETVLNFRNTLIQGYNETDVIAESCFGIQSEAYTNEVRSTLDL